jgi:sugar phosphate isomerase/epimerase
MLSRRKFLGVSALAMSGLALSARCSSGESKKLAPFRISLNVSTIRTYKLPIEQQIDVCAAAGFDGIELWTSDIQDYQNRGGSLAALATQLKDNRLVLENIIGFAQWAADDQDKRNAGVLQMQREMEITATLGGKYIAAPMMGIARLERSLLDDYAQRYLRIIEAGKPLGVTPLLELWGSGVLYKLADAVHIATATGHPDANLLLDFYHLYRGGNSFDSLNLINVAHLPVFHINDFPAIPPREQLNDRDRVYPGDGICPLDTLIPLLYRGGFRGGFSVELFNEEYCRNKSVEQVLATTLEKTKKVIII